jgi:hypothetical protein
MKEITLEATEKLGIPANDRPNVKLVGTDGNVFALMGKSAATLKKAGYREKAAEMLDRITGGKGFEGTKSYSEALVIMGEYLNIH